MDWLLPLAAALVVLALLIPLSLLLGTVLVLGASGWLSAEGPIVSRATFDCPFSKRRANVEFLTPRGSDRPSDVRSCSVFPKPDPIRCKKGCLNMAVAGWAPSPMMPRYALLADGVALRPVSAGKSLGRGSDRRPSGQMPRAA